MSDQAEQLQERLLVMRCQIGDEQAYRELVHRYAPRLHYFLQKLIRDRDEVHDLLQEVWIDVFRQLPRLQDVGAFTAWIYRIARGKATLQLRKTGRAIRGTDCVELVAAPEDDEPFAPEDAARVHVALDQLEYEHREVLVLRFLEGLNYEDIGLIVGCPVGTVRSRIHYAKRALKRRLEHII